MARSDKARVRAKKPRAPQPALTRHATQTGQIRTIARAS